jgi:hypothetical protein
MTDKHKTNDDKYDDYIDENEYNKYIINNTFISICGDHCKDEICEYCEKYYLEN